MATVSAGMCQCISQTVGLGCMKDSALSVGLTHWHTTIYNTWRTYKY